MIESITSIGIFIDGGYFTKINQALEEKLSLNIDITFFFKFIKEKIAYEYNLNTEFCQITESRISVDGTVLTMLITNICYSVNVSLKIH